MAPTPTRVKIEYIGRLADGFEFDRNRPGEPLGIVKDRRTVMEPIMDAVFAMEVGEEAYIDVPHEMAYGEYNPRALLIVPRSHIERGNELKVGEQIVWRSAQKPQPVAVRVVDGNETSVLLDFNHPLAGKDLQYWVKIVDLA